MLRRLPTLLTLTLSVASLVCVTACKKEETVEPEAEDATDRLARELLAALESGDSEAALALASPSLTGDLDERNVTVIARTLRWLDGLDSLERASEEPVVDGVRRSYQLGFGRGELALTITAVAGKVEGFEFDQGAWAGFVDEAAAAEAGDLKVAKFQFVDLTGNPLDAPNDPANIGYDLAIEGLESQLREHHVQIEKQVLDAEGNQVYRQNKPDDIRFSQSESGASGGMVSGAVGVPAPGSYEIVLEIHDLIGGNTLEHRVAFSVTAAPEPPPPKRKKKHKR